MAVLLSMFLVACGEDEKEKEPSPADENESSEVENDSEEENNEISDTHLDNGDYVYEIKEVEQITSQYDDTQILAVELTFTNNTGDPTSPWMSQGIKAEQETDATVELLNGANGLFPDDYKTELVEMGDTDIKPGATVDAVIGFEILYPGEPVNLLDFSFDDTVSFERVVETE